MENELPGEIRGGSPLMRKVLLSLAAVLVLLVVLYFAFSSSGFVRGVILPRVGKALNSQIRVSDASLRPFSQVVLKQLTLQPAGHEPLLTADEVRVRYSLFSILRGHYVIHEVSLVSPTLQIVEKPGGSNLDAVTRADRSSPRRPESDRPLRLTIGRVSVKDGTIRKQTQAHDGSISQVELSQANLDLDQLRNGGQGQLSFATQLRMLHRLPATNDSVQGNMEGKLGFTLNQQLLPQTLTGDIRLALAQAQGAYGELAGLSGHLQAEVTPSEVRQLALRFQRGGADLGQIQASGPLDLAKNEGRLKLEIRGIDRNVLNFYGAGRGWDFGQTTLNATNYLDLARGGEIIAAKGHLSSRQFTVRQQDQAIPPFNLEADYEVSLNLSEQSAVLRTLALEGEKQGQRFLQASLDRPMTLTWAPTARGFVESTFQLALSQVDLAEWSSFLGTNSPSGRLDLRLSVAAREDGKKLTTKAQLTVQQLAARLAANQITNASLALELDALLENFNVVTLNRGSLDLQQFNQKLLTVEGSAHYDLTKGDLNLQASTDVVLPKVLAFLPPLPLAATNGTVRLSSTVLQKGQKYSLTGNLSVADFTGSLSGYLFQDLHSALRYNVDFEAPALRIHNAALTLRKGYKAAGNISITGNYDINSQAAQLSFDIVDLNEAALSPILAPSEGGGRLASISVGGNGSATYLPQGESTATADLKLANWVVETGRQARPVRLDAQVKLNGALRKQVLELRQFLLALSPTERARNQLELKARLDFAQTNSSPSELSLEADSLDLTPYYAMFSGGTNQAAAPQPAKPPQATPPVSATEPEPAQLPVQQLTAALKIGRLFVQEVAVTNLQATARVRGGEVTLQPLAMTVNGGALKADAKLNLGVPGYAYDLSMNLNGVPVEPLANTFTTNPPGTYQGNLIADLQVKGAGVTGPSLQKNLAGSLNLSLTNLHYEIVGRVVKRLLEPIAIVLRVPELMQTPLNWIGAQAEVGNGQINLQQFNVRSQAFFAKAQGGIPIGETLLKSPLALPVELSIHRSLAQKANLLDPATPTNAVYASLPTFVKMEGTLGEPETKVNKLVIGGLLARSIGGIVPADKAGNILQGIGGILSGQPRGTNDPAQANTNKATGLLQDISNLIRPGTREGAATNAAAGATNKPARPSPLDLLKLLPERK